MTTVPTPSDSQDGARRRPNWALTMYEDRFDELKRERDEARATVRRMLHAATELLRREMQHSGRGRDGHLNVDDIAVVLNAIEPPAVDQTAPSSPLETSQAADGGEAGVVEGAGGSEAAEGVAQRFHEAYERLAPQYGYETREASAKPWADVPANNRALMTAVCAEVAPLLIAEGRRQAARQIIARDEAEGDWDINMAYWAAVRIAEGTEQA